MIVPASVASCLQKLSANRKVYIQVEIGGMARGSAVKSGRGDPVFNCLTQRQRGCPALRALCEGRVFRLPTLFAFSIAHAMRPRSEISPHPTFTLTGPVSSRRLGAGPGLPYEQPRRRLPHASWGSKRGHHYCRDQEIFLNRISALWGSLARTSPASWCPPFEKRERWATNCVPVHAKSKVGQPPESNDRGA
jgi:hypothetical protein